MVDEKKAGDDGEYRLVTEQENRISFSGPAPGANRFYITIGQPGVRIAFCEAIPDTEDVAFRAAVTLHPLDAIQLHKVLKRLIDPIEKNIVSVSKKSIIEDSNDDG